MARLNGTRTMRISNRSTIRPTVELLERRDAPATFGVPWANPQRLTLSFVPPADWFVGCRTLEELGVASFWLDIKVTDGTNTKGEKAAYLAEIFAFMREVFGALHEHSYAFVHQVSGASYGFGGVSQEARGAI